MVSSSLLQNGSLRRRVRSRRGGLRRRGPGARRGGTGRGGGGCGAHGFHTASQGSAGPDHGHVQPRPPPAELPHRQPVALHIRRGQHHQENREADHRMAISFPQETCSEVVASAPRTATGSAGHLQGEIHVLRFTTSCYVFGVFSCDLQLLVEAGD